MPIVAASVHSARSPIARELDPLAPRITPTTPVRPIEVLTSSQPKARSRSATNWAVASTSYMSSGF
jgi:hypothetical protein